MGFSFFLKKIQIFFSQKRKTMERDSLSEDTWTGSRVRSFRNGKPSKKNEKKHRYDDSSSLSPRKNSSLARTGVKRRVQAFRRSLRDITRRDDKLLRGSRTSSIPKTDVGGLSPTLRNSINEVSQELDFAMSDINKRAGYRPRSTLSHSSFSRNSYSRRSNSSPLRESSYDVSNHLKRLRESVDRRVRAIDEVRDEVRTDRVDHLSEKMQKLVEQSGAIVSELEVDMAAKVSLLRDSVKRRMEAIERIQLHGEEDAKNDDENWRFSSSYSRNDDVEDRVETRAAEMMIKPKIDSLVEINHSSEDDEREQNYDRGDRVEVRHNGRWRRARIVRSFRAALCLSLSRILNMYPFTLVALQNTCKQTHTRNTRYVRDLMKIHMTYDGVEMEESRKMFCQRVFDLSTDDALDDKDEEEDEEKKDKNFR